MKRRPRLPSPKRRQRNDLVKARQICNIQTVNEQRVMVIVPIVMYIGVIRILNKSGRFEEIAIWLSG